MTQSIADRGSAERRVRLGVLGAAALALVFVAGAFAAPLFDRAGSPWGAALYRVYEPACHQKPERSLAIGGAPVAVCARCSGLYLGGAFGLLAAGLFLIGRPRLRPLWLVVALAPTAVDTLLPWIGLPQLPLVPRLMVAVAAGVVAALFLAHGLADLFARRVRTEPPHSARSPGIPCSGGSL